MKCFYHPAVDSVQGCRACGKWLCSSCAHSIKGAFYCQDCLVKGAELSVIASRSTINQDSPGRAAVMAFIPGMGAVYNRQYTKGLIHFGVFAALCLLAEGHPIFALGAVAFWVFQVLDAYRSAQAVMRQRLAHPEWIPEEEKVNAPVWGLILMGVGLLFLVDNLVEADIFRFVDKLWPLAFVALGAYLMWDYLKEKKSGAIGGPRKPGGGISGISDEPLQPYQTNREGREIL